MLEWPARWCSICTSRRMLTLLRWVCSFFLEMTWGRGGNGEGEGDRGGRGGAKI